VGSEAEAGARVCFFELAFSIFSVIADDNDSIVAGAGAGARLFHFLLSSASIFLVIAADKMSTVYSPTLRLSRNLALYKYFIDRP
jgi:hypothetical protein